MLHKAFRTFRDAIAADAEAKWIHFFFQSLIPRLLTPKLMAFVDIVS
ncbi:hypothetical protein V6C03_08540 [Methyloligella sp. 2.7D]|nr:hypothetical protein [Methyloligella sp. GL2]QKP78083.1 hypothetical protein HT051_11910 [Methyloligella sp. GL2]